jgi:hypothetical protein
VGYGENDNLFTVQLVDNRLREFANDETPPLAIKLRPAQRVLRDKADATVYFSFKVCS